MNSYTYDTHVHTSEVSSCGKVEAATLVHLYKNEGYTGIVITDHYYSEYFNSLCANSWEEKIDCFLKGYRTACNEGKKIGLNVILGAEIRFDESSNDYLVYGMNEAFLYNNPRLYEHTLTSFRHVQKSSSLLIYQAHPYRLGMTPANPADLDGVEVFNGNPRHNSSNDRAYEFAKGNNLKMISGSDFHQKMDLARGGIILPDAPSDSKGFVQLLGKNKIIKLLGEISPA